jgi:hypothetical protein
MRMLSLPLHIIFWDLSDPRLRKVRRGAWCLLLLPSWKQKVFLKHCCCSTRLHGVILLTPSDPARWRKFPCMIHHTQSTVKVCVSCYVAVHVASKLKLNVSSCLSLIWKIYKYMCRHMVIMRFVSWSGDGIEKFVWGREALAWSVAARGVKSPVQQSTKVKDQCLWGDIVR